MVVLWQIWSSWIFFPFFTSLMFNPCSGVYMMHVHQIQIDIIHSKMNNQLQAAIRQTPSTHTHTLTIGHTPAVCVMHKHTSCICPTLTHMCALIPFLPGLIAASFLTQERHATLHTIIMSRRQRRILVQGVITGKRNSRWRRYHIVKQPSAGHLNTPQGHKQRCEDFRGSTI